MNPRHALLPALAALALMGCSRDEVHAYRVPKEDPMAGVPAAARASAATQPTDAPALTWQAPNNWEEKPAGGFRRGSFNVPGEDGATADLSIIAFPGAAGGLGANLNRWRGQVGLPALPEDQVQAEVRHVDTPSFHVDFVNYAGTSEGKPTRILGAILEYGTESWFFKLMGPDDLVANEEAAFEAFIQTVAPAAPAP